jgi:outer membrane protein OmpA-like peptidoglycan-associated protein
VTGFTDATYSDAAGAKLARQRAFTVRDALMAEGVPATHVNVAYHAAGLFAVDNGSATGKALNRRAEIVAKGDPVEPRG